MTTEPPEIMPDSPIAAVTIDRIGEILTEQGLEFRLEESAESGRILRTGFRNTVIAMQVREDILVVDSLWRGQIPTATGPQLLHTVNQWNSEHYAPTLRFFETSDQALAVSAVREFNVATGASRNQLGAFLMSTLNAVLEAFAFIEQTYPQLVTWQEHNHG